jgi:hypothetical protein
MKTLHSFYLTEDAMRTMISGLLKAYGEAIESHSDTLAYLTDEDKLAAAAAVLSELKLYVRKYDIELKRIIKARKDAMPGFLRDVEAGL